MGVSHWSFWSMVLLRQRPGEPGGDVLPPLADRGAGQIRAVRGHAVGQRAVTAGQLGGKRASQVADTLNASSISSEIKAVMAAVSPRASRACSSAVTSPQPCASNTGR